MKKRQGTDPGWNCECNMDYVILYIVDEASRIVYLD